MIYVVIFISVVGAYWGLYWLITGEIKDSNDEILDELNRVEKQNNLLRKEVNELLHLLDSVWVNTNIIINNTIQDKEEKKWHKTKKK